MVLSSSLAAGAEPPARPATTASSAVPGETAGAAPGPRSDALLEQGIELRRSGRDEQALPVLEEAAALAPESTRARVHLAAAHQALGHWLEADALLREVLQESDDAYIQRHQATLVRAAEFVSRHLGSLLVSGAPAGALVQVNGRKLGSLPLQQAARMPVGAYELQVSLAGYYPVRRPINIASGAVLREAVELTPRSPPLSAPGSVSRDAPRRSGGSPRWLSWTLSGLAAGAAVTTGVALVVRNQHAARWNSASCLDSGRRRGEVCPDELDAGKTAERVAYVSGVATVLFAAGAVLSWTLDAPESPGAGVELAGCRFGLAGGMCSGSF